MVSTCEFAGRECTYDTDNATVVAHVTHGEFGDPAGYEETLYRTPGRRYFIHGVGGATSPYPEPSIVPVTKAEGLARF